nr:MAG TPA: hypothetical protein [Caudoviricetes sp.]
MRYTTKTRVRLPSAPQTYNNKGLYGFDWRGSKYTY